MGEASVHPFTDGNGRVGRASIHTVLARRGMVQVAVLPVSLVMLTRSDTYVAGLTEYRYEPNTATSRIPLRAEYRYEGPPPESEAQRGAIAWLSMFLDAVDVATEQAAQFADEIASLRNEWDLWLIAERQKRGVRDRRRTDSAMARLLDALPEAPPVTARIVERKTSKSWPRRRSSTASR